MSFNNIEPVKLHNDQVPFKPRSNEGQTQEQPQRQSEEASDMGPKNFAKPTGRFARRFQQPNPTDAQPQPPPTPGYVQAPDARYQSPPALATTQAAANNQTAAVTTADPTNSDDERRLGRRPRRSLYNHPLDSSKSIKDDDPNCIDDGDEQDYSDGPLSDEEESNRRLEAEQRARQDAQPASNVNSNEDFQPTATNKGKGRAIESSHATMQTAQQPSNATLLDGDTPGDAEENVQLYSEREGFTWDMDENDVNIVVAGRLNQMLEIPEQGLTQVAEDHIMDVDSSGNQLALPESSLNNASQGSVDTANNNADSSIGQGNAEDGWSQPIPEWELPVLDAIANNDNQPTPEAVNDWLTSHSTDLNDRSSVPQISNDVQMGDAIDINNQPAALPDMSLQGDLSAPVDDYNELYDTSPRPIPSQPATNFADPTTMPGQGLQSSSGDTSTQQTAQPGPPSTSETPSTNDQMPERYGGDWHYEQSGNDWIPVWHSPFRPPSDWPFLSETVAPANNDIDVERDSASALQNDFQDEVRSSIEDASLHEPHNGREVPHLWSAREPEPEVRMSTHSPEPIVSPVSENGEERTIVRPDGNDSEIESIRQRIDSLPLGRDSPQDNDQFTIEDTSRAPVVAPPLVSSEGTFRWDGLKKLSLDDGQPNIDRTRDRSRKPLPLESPPQKVAAGGGPPAPDPNGDPSDDDGDDKKGGGPDHANDPTPFDRNRHDENEQPDQDSGTALPAADDQSSVNGLPPGGAAQNIQTPVPITSNPIGQPTGHLVSVTTSPWDLPTLRERVRKSEQHVRKAKEARVKHRLQRATLLLPLCSSIPKETLAQAYSAAIDAWQLAKELQVDRILQARCEFYVGYGEVVTAGLTSEHRPKRPDSMYGLDGFRPPYQRKSHFENVVDTPGVFAEKKLAREWIDELDKPAGYGGKPSGLDGGNGKDDDDDDRPSDDKKPRKKNVNHQWPGELKRDAVKEESSQNEKSSGAVTISKLANVAASAANRMPISDRTALTSSTYMPKHRKRWSVFGRSLVKSEINQMEEGTSPVRAAFW